VHALAPDDEIGQEGFDGVEKGLWFGGQVPRQFDRSGLVEDADEERSCVQIDADIRCSGCGEETHDEASGVRPSERAPPTVNRNLHQYPGAAPDPAT